jgi:hypothetical protein
VHRCDPPAQSPVALLARLREACGGAAAAAASPKLTPCIPPCCPACTADAVAPSLTLTLGGTVVSGYASANDRSIFVSWSMTTVDAAYDPNPKTSVTCKWAADGNTNSVTSEINSGSGSTTVGSLFFYGTTSVLCTATDAAGNVGPGLAFSVVVTCPPGYSYNAADKQCRGALSRARGRGRGLRARKQKLRQVIGQQAATFKSNPPAPAFCVLLQPPRQTSTSAPSAAAASAPPTLTASTTPTARRAPSSAAARPATWTPAARTMAASARVSAAERRRAAEGQGAAG